MKILVTGADGMLGSALCPALRRRGHEVIPTDLRPVATSTQPLDICNGPAVEQLIKTAAPDIVLHLAAETDVDRCEQEPVHAYAVNAVGTEHVVRACRAMGTRLLYMSTAAVFDGLKPTPYVETDPPNPVNVYGRTKLAGESVVRAYPAHLIVRAGWMVGGYERDKKFVWKLLRLLEERRELSVVTDTRGSLTFTDDLSEGIAGLIETAHVGIFHIVNHGACSRYDIACKLLELLGRRDVTIRPVTSAAFPLPAPRPASEVLENHRLQSLGLDTMPSWDEALRAYVQRYVASLTVTDS